METIFNPHLDGNPFFWQAGPVGVLLVHGLTATTAEVRPLAEFLHASGFTVAAPLLPGHYTKPEDLNSVSWIDWVSATEEMYIRLCSTCDTVVVGGESTGGLLSLEMAVRHPETRAMLLYAPALRLNMGLFDRLRLMVAAPFIPWRKKPNMDEGSTLWQGYTVNPLKAVLQLLKLQERVKSRLTEVRQPILIVQGKLDPTVDPAVPEMISNHVSSKDIEIHWMDNSSHCVIIDGERSQVNQITLHFLKQVLKSTP